MGTVFVLIALWTSGSVGRVAIELPYYSSQQSCVMAANQIKKDLRADATTCLPTDRTTNRGIG